MIFDVTRSQRASAESSKDSNIGPQWMPGDWLDLRLQTYRFKELGECYEARGEVWYS